MLCVAAPVQAQTAPGTMIRNTADVVYTVDGVPQRVTSNTVTFAVAERLDVGIMPGGDGPPAIMAMPTPVPIVVTNMGSGGEAFTVDASATPGTTVDMVAIDRDDDGVFDAGQDPVLTGSTPVLAPGEALHLVAVVTPTGAPVDGALTVMVRAETGSGEEDRSFPGAGDGGGDAVVGRTGAAATAQLPFVAARSGPTLTKSQAVRAPDGSSSAASGAVVTYTLVARFPQGGVRAARIDDPVPAGTIYLPGTLTLDGAALTDAADGDAGSGGGSGGGGGAIAIAIALGDIAAPVTRTVTFQVRLP